MSKHSKHSSMVFDRIDAISKLDPKGRPKGIKDQHKKLCKDFDQEVGDLWLEAHREQVKWASSILLTDACLLDTETTGRDEAAEIIEIAATRFDESLIVDSLVKPTRRIAKGAMAVHGIAQHHVENAPAWPDVWGSMRENVERSSCLIAYNGTFDARLIEQSCFAHKLPAPKLPPLLTPDLMIRAGIWIGDWDAKWNHYKWHKLESGHRALGDVQGMIRVVRAMAASPVGSL